MAAFLFALAGLLASPTPVELGPAEEVALAASAAPADLARGAGVYRLGAAGYELVRPSANGFYCLVGRDPEQGIAPACYDAEGAATVMQAQLLRGALLRRGLADAEIEQEIAARYRDGRLLAPRRAGVAYMLSHRFSRYDARRGRRTCVFPPHVMIYAPYRTNEEIGNGPGDRGSLTQPWILHEGAPDAYIIVAMAHGRAARCE
ncbi:MAG: hypothetical protein JO276_11905 [Sphingomonadaceae bacterium]|nr:hypothetical protein [Sphingomonadaceae bacterium]